MTAEDLEKLFDVAYELGEAERYDEQLAAWEQLVPLCREKDDPSWGKRDLGFALAGLGITLFTLDREAEAVAPLREAVSIARKLVADDAAQAPTLARWLNWLSDSLAAEGRSHEALAAAEEAVAIGRGLIDIPSNRRALADYLADFSRLLTTLGRVDEALASQQEAVAQLSRLSQVEPDIHSSRLARALRGLVLRQRKAGSLEQAAATALEYVTICRGLVASQQAGAEGMLADALELRMSQLRALDRPHEALDAANEWLEVARRLAADAPADDRSARQSLGEALQWVATICRRLGRHGEVLTVGGEAINYFRTIFPLLDDYGRYVFADTLLDYANALAVHRRPIDAVRAAWDAVAILRELGRELPHKHMSSLRFGLLYLADFAAAAGNLQLATSATYEAQAIERTLPAGG